MEDGGGPTTADVLGQIDDEDGHDGAAVEKSRRRQIASWKR